jgi:hypothetical protein
VEIEEKVEEVEQEREEVGEERAREGDISFSFSWITLILTGWAKILMCKLSNRNEIYKQKIQVKEIKIKIN